MYNEEPIPCHKCGRAIKKPNTSLVLAFVMGGWCTDRKTPAWKKRQADFERQLPTHKAGYKL